MTVEEDEDDDEEVEEGQLNSHNVNFAGGRVKISNSCTLEPKELLLKEVMKRGASPQL